MRLRPANPDDSEHIVRLVEMAGEGQTLQFWRGMTVPGEEAWRGDDARRPREIVSESWRSAVIAEIEGDVAGLVVVYPIGATMTATDGLPEIVRPVQALENLATGTFCVNILAVYEPYRRRQVATELLRHVIGKAAGRDVSIIVGDEHVAALNLLAALGFREQARLRVPKPKGDENEVRAWILLRRSGNAT